MSEPVLWTQHNSYRWDAHRRHNMTTAHVGTVVCLNGPNHPKYEGRSYHTGLSGLGSTVTVTSHHRTAQAAREAVSNRVRNGIIVPPRIIR